MRKDKIRFRVNGLWSQWQDAGLLKVPEEVEAIETSETMTKEQALKSFPDRKDEIESL